MADQSPSSAKPARLLLADVDGTLVTKEKVLTDRAKKAVHDLRAAGIEFAITSGRPPRGMSMLFESLGITTPVAGFNGGVFSKTDLSIIEQHALGKDVVEPAIKIIEEHKLDVWIYREIDWFVHARHGAHVDKEEWTVKFAPIVVDDYNGKMDGVAKIVGVSDDLEAVARCEKAVREALGEKVSAARSQPYYLDVTHPEANKGGVVTALSRMLGIPTDQIATIGDMPNDVPMFEKGGLSIAMGQAKDEVKQAAHEVTAGYDDEGFAKAVEKFILRKES